VAARELDVGPELLVEPEPDPAVACVRVRACKRIKGAVAAEPESSVRICAECHSRRQAADMLQCPQCVRWFHRTCGGVRSVYSVPVPLDWCCGACTVAVHGSPDASPMHTHRLQRREGPWRSRCGRCKIFLSFFQLQERWCASDILAHTAVSAAGGVALHAMFMCRASSSSVRSVPFGVRSVPWSVPCRADQPPDSMLWRVLVYVVVDLAAYGFRCLSVCVSFGGLGCA
jgi:hypothetical protein